MKRKPKPVPMAYVTITWELPVGDAKALVALYGKRKARKGGGR